MTDVLTTAVVTAITAGGGAYLGAYLRKKGEGRALKEDLDSIVEQLRKTTAAQEEIKAEIAGGLWINQSRWTFRAELYRTLLESLGDTSSALRQLIFVDEQRPKFKGQADTEKFIDDIEREYGPKAGVAFERLVRASSVAGIWLDESAMRALDDLKTAWIKAHEGPPTATSFAAKCIDAAKVAMEALTEAARDDLQLKVRKAP